MAVREPGSAAAPTSKGRRARSLNCARPNGGSSIVDEWWGPHAVNGSLTEGATSCLTVGQRCRKDCQSAFNRGSVLSETTYTKCGSSIRLERKMVVFRNFA
jgi:hypothetical protein